MKDKYVVIRLDNSISRPMSKKEAINTVRNNYNNGISSYIVTQEEGERIRKEGGINTPKWS